MNFISWAILGIFFLIIEALTVTFFAIFFAFASFIMCFISFAVKPFMAQLSIYTILVLLSIPLVVVLKKKLAPKNALKTNNDLIIGSEGKVISRIDGKYNPGIVKVNSSSWSAISDTPIEAGEIVEVLEINGVKLKVRRK